MKAAIRTTITCLAAAVALAPRAISAASDTTRELDQITADRDKAIAAAAQPINRIYQTALEALQQRATQANDLDTALHIKQALERLSARAEILGTWNFVNHADGVRYVAEFKADNTFFWDGRQVGVWDTDGKRIIITHYNRGGHSDYYTLPVRDGKLDGRNTRGDKVTITATTQDVTITATNQDVTRQVEGLLTGKEWVHRGQYHYKFAEKGRIQQDDRPGRYEIDGKTGTVSFFWDAGDHPGEGLVFNKIDGSFRHNDGGEFVPAGK